MLIAIMNFFYFFIIITVPIVIVLGEAWAKFIVSRNLEDLSKRKFFTYESPSSSYIILFFRDDFILAKSVKEMNKSRNKDLRRLFYIVMFVRYYTLISIIIFIPIMIIFSIYDI